MAEYLGEHDTIEEDLASQLPAWYPKDDGSGNWKLLATIGSEIGTLNTDAKLVDQALTVQDANTIDQIERIAKLVDLPPNRDETLEHYRARVLARFQALTSEATISDALNSVATILNADVENLTYTEEHTTEPGVCQIGVPGSRLDSFQLAGAEFAEIVDDLIAGGYRVDVLQRGTFTYLSESDYTGSGSYDPADLDSNITKAHDGLDTNGDPKDNGGTYAGVLQ